MSSRNTIIGAAIAALAGTVQVGTRIYRSRAVALAKDKLPALVVRRGDETVTQSTNAYVDRLLELLVEIHTRGDAAEEDSETIATSAHPKIMSDAGLAALIVDIAETGSSFELADADGAACMATNRYLIHYRTARAAV